jgi:CRP/FNR family cyclic AMP-dependent transcriptional regulator
MDEQKAPLFNEIAETSPFIEMPELDWSSVTGDLEVCTFKSGTIIYQQDSMANYIYLVKKGRVRVDLYSYNGELRSLFFASTGCLFGEISPIDELPNRGTAVATIPSKVYLIPKARFQREMNENIRFCNNVALLLARKFRYLTALVELQSFYNSYYKVGYVLIHLIRSYGVQSQEGYLLNIAFTHQEMASLTGLSRVSVSKILADFKARGIIEKRNGNIIIPDIDALYCMLLENVNI